MENLDKYIADNNHLEILNIDNKSINLHKCIALIHLKKYNEALTYCSDSFEKAYIYYKLKKYKKAMKILKKIQIEGKKKDILMAQILFKLKYYNAALNILYKYIDDEIYINIIAAESLIEGSKIFQISNRSIISKSSYNNEVNGDGDKKSDNNDKSEDKMNDTINNNDNITTNLTTTNNNSTTTKLTTTTNINYTLKDKELEKEKEYNETFKYFNDEDKFIAELESKNDNELIMNQLKNIKGFYNNLYYDIMSNRDKEIVEANKEKKNIECLYVSLTEMEKKEINKIPKQYKILRAYKLFKEKKYNSAIQILDGEECTIARAIKCLCGETKDYKNILKEIKK
ncbi:hypothetical protein SLOPH_1813 [Spraguea lophii 42_110]|uniref:Tetratricopeptide repeat protein n=1 Tax=Spraguea lophii (strain 42_110) TaxID=1358809 RepID=S7W8Y1_SPRLO|nr:hypothetical protein SLOPH_1813 [Spraguea lophii 42_110]